MSPGRIIKRIRIGMVVTLGALALTASPPAALAGTDCKAIQAQITSLQHQLADLAKQQAADMKGASPGEKAAIIKMYKQEKKPLEQQLAQKKAQFNACVKSPIAHVPMTIRVAGVHCAVETDENGADEPYVLVYAVDLTTMKAVSVGGVTTTVPFPTAHAGLTGEWEDVDHGEYHSAAELAPDRRRPFWSLSGKKRVIANADDVVFLAVLMENDEGNPKTVRSVLEAEMSVFLASGPTGDRAVLVQQLEDGMTGALDIARKLGTEGLNFDDKAGPVRELRLTENDLRYVAHMGELGKSLPFAGDGGSYQVDVDLKS
jgi:hypothetical protein